MTYSFLDLAHDVLKEAPNPITHREIWEQAKEHGLDKKVNSQGATPWSTLGSLLSIDILHKSEKTRFCRFGKPHRYFLKSRQREVDEKEFPLETVDKKVTEKTTYDEKDLHPLLAYLAYTNSAFAGERQIHTKTIAHQKTKRGNNSLKEWLHPDMVGVYAPFADMEKSVIDLSKALNTNSGFQIFSFELKKSINRGNYREYFFQAVSNSSWAHEGYLVAAEISENEELHQELGRLTNAFGIGIIHLNVRDIHSSSVLFEAHNKTELDWDTINKLCSVNKDFASFIDRLNTDFGAGQIHPFEYDEIKDPIADYIRKTLKVKAVQ